MITAPALVAQEERFARAFAAGDLSLARALYHPAVVYLSPTVRLFGWPARIEGVERTLEFIGLTIRRLEAITYHAVEWAIVPGGGAAFVRIQFDFTRAGQRLRSEYVVVYRYRDGLIGQQELYYDPSGPLEEVGEPPRRPRRGGLRAAQGDRSARAASARRPGARGGQRIRAATRSSAGSAQPRRRAQRWGEAERTRRGAAQGNGAIAVIVADTGAIIALLDADDPHHHTLRALYEERPEVWLLPWAILPEVDYLAATQLGQRVEQAFVDDLASGGFTVEWGAAADLGRARELSTRYRGLKLGLVDTVVMAVAERRRAEAIATLDLRHFGAVQMRGRPKLVPRDL